MLVLLLPNPIRFNKPKFVSLLQPSDQEKALHLRNGVVRAQFIAGRLLLKECLYRFTRGKTFDSKIIYDCNGKPKFDTDQIKFNISHTNKLVACAVTKKDVGIDIEMNNRKLGASLATILNNKQIHEYNNLDKKERRPFLLKQWVWLEACVKLTGEGLAGIWKIKDRIKFKRYQKTTLNHCLAIATYQIEKIKILKVENLTFASGK